MMTHIHALHRLQLAEVFPSHRTTFVVATFDADRRSDFYGIKLYIELELPMAIQLHGLHDLQSS